MGRGKMGWKGFFRFLCCGFWGGFGAGVDDGVWEGAVEGVGVWVLMGVLVRWLVGIGMMITRFIFNNLF